MLTPDQLSALRAAAEAATPGPWRTGGSKPDGLHEITVYGSQVVIDTDIGPKVLLEGNSNFQAESVANAAYIAAANPAAILALLAHVDVQEARITELVRDVARSDRSMTADDVIELAAQIATPCHVWARPNTGANWVLIPIQPGNSRGIEYGMGTWQFAGPVIPPESACSS
ncbi:ead/Ea22-like family protein [Chromobacterium paludis]|uniref:Uncharacterized protein n=1 Tax=Chromobacterium paludis TaxID=2605945 RepID=A0A5C1DFB9_9NEIS|nr:ead/Ea22-like family protein [Chromobacterium paludis]QEL55460.1 hypothetical protein FYK34_07725 [Chromobacterium paludis]